MTTELRFLAASIILGLVHLSRRLALDQFPTWLSLDGQQSRAARAAAVGRGQSGILGLHQLHGDISVLCNRGSGRASDRSSYRAHFMGSAALLLGAAWLCTRGCGGLRDDSFHVARCSSTPR
jgi:formylglycine-generating enzyme required for sulfatase activity